MENHDRTKYVLSLLLTYNSDEIANTLGNVIKVMHEQIPNHEKLFSFVFNLLYTAKIKKENVSGLSMSASLLG